MSSGVFDTLVDRPRGLQPPRYLSKVLLADRGEIAIRILRTAQELGWSAGAVYTPQGTSNATLANEAIKFTQATLRARLNTLLPTPGRPNDTSIGPALEPLRFAGDNILSYLRRIPMCLLSGIRYPATTKAVDGGGGRGMRVVSAHERIDDAFKQCMGETQSSQFSSGEHVEAQIAGDGMGDVTQVWERACSVQRRFRKLVEMAPSTVTRSLVQLLLASTTMAYAVEHGVAIAWRGVRVDTRLCHAGVRERSVGTYFGSLLAMILVRGQDLGEETQQAVRAPRETGVGNEEGGVKTNRAVLAGRGRCDKDWGGPAQAAGRRIGFTGAIRRRRSDRHLDLWERHSISSSPPGSNAAADTKKQIHQTLGPVDYLYRLAQ
ncbi:hypothetical protein FIBSPDRAFT_934897 [Athelia psychrophila]|uniref:Biotin carboxylation domain-containing protein n=1 Tax=Athelia psychrophila TaxID=1759441 RepID=A0A166ERW9_9AGAM|nr:hypothetical protein FIBSPDRAFT_934897 [Fibularhizoctonia sp. CBS 109695]